MENKDVLSKGIRLSGIALPVIIFAPLLITMGFKGIKLEDTIIGWILLSIGFLTAIAGIIMLFLGIRYILDHLFEK